MIASELLKNGYFRVGDAVYTSKVAALIDGTRRNIHPEWQFHPEVFGAVDWTTEPPLPIQHYYAQRARGIREKYDYVVLMYSAGSDSQTVLDSFLNNGHQVDEIVVSWASSLKYNPDASNFKFENTLSEWDYTILPRLKQLAQTHPEIKITVHDWTKDIDQVTIADDAILNKGLNFTIYGEQRWDFARIDSIQRAIDRHQRIAIVWGSDKPRVCINDGHYCLYFLDMVAQSFSNADENCMFSELFYWSPESTQLLAKQSHMVANFFEANPKFKSYIKWPTSNPVNRQFYENVVRAIVYPDFDLSTFQVNKSLDPVLNADELLFSAGDELRNRVILTNRRNFDYLQTVIAPKYFTHNERGTGFTGFISPMYRVQKA